MHVCKVCVLFLNFHPLRAVLDQNGPFCSFYSLSSQCVAIAILLLESVEKCIHKVILLYESLLFIQLIAMSFIYIIIMSKICSV